MIGALGILRSVERLLLGAQVIPIQIMMGVGFLVLAWICIRKARPKAHAGQEHAMQGAKEFDSLAATPKADWQRHDRPEE